MTISPGTARHLQGGPPGPGPEGASLLVASGITRSFGNNLANDDIDLEIRAGRLHALLGENGAGKTTLISILSGQYRADAGEIRVRGSAVEPRSPREGLRAGIGVVYQDFRLVPKFTVTENVILGTSEAPGPKAERRVAAAAKEIGFELDPHELVGRLGVGKQQQVEVLKLLYRGTEILILDEPTAVLTPQQSRRLFAALRKLADSGKAVVFITHRLREVSEGADWVTVLRDGRVVADRAVADLDHARLAELMIGERLVETEIPAGAAANPVLKLAGVHCGSQGRGSLRGVDLEVRGGEIVAVAGVSGNGQLELAEVAAGVRPIDSGERAVDADSTAFIPEDRLLTGLVGQMSIADNLAFRRYDRPPFSTRLWLRVHRIRDHAQRLVSEFAIPTRSTRDAVGKLSGGGLQRVILARELEPRPGLIVASQPTRGLDVVSLEAIRGRLIAARDAGAAVLMITEDLDEAIEMADRVIVIYSGEIVGEFSRGEADRAQLGLLMGGGRRRATADKVRA